jgi:hypothetical protein
MMEFSPASHHLIRLWSSYTIKDIQKLDGSKGKSTYPNRLDVKVSTNN